MINRELDETLRQQKETVVKLTNLKKNFGQTVALDDISYEIKAGEIFGFLGPSGSGKTTTIKILTNQLKPTGGSASVLGKDSKRIDEDIYRNIGILTDTSGLYEKLSVHENLSVFADILGVDKKEIDIVLNRVQLNEQRKLAAGKLSKGQKQRLCLARAILHKPKLLFLDEPTSGLDPTTAIQIQDLFLELKAQGTAIFLTTHDMHEATKLCDQIALLDNGKILEYGTPNEICMRYNDNKQFQIALSSGKTVTLENSESDQLVLIDFLKNNEIETLHTCEPTLEDVFVQIAGRKFV